MKKLPREIWKKNNQKINTYNDYGYQTLIVWGRELKHNKDDLIAKLKDFNNGGN